MVQNVLQLSPVKDEFLAGINLHQITQKKQLSQKSPITLKNLRRQLFEGFGFWGIHLFSIGEKTCFHQHKIESIDCYRSSYALLPSKANF